MFGYLGTNYCQTGRVYGISKLGVLDVCTFVGMASYDEKTTLKQWWGLGCNFTPATFGRRKC